MSEPETLKIECSSCKGHIEFPVDMHGKVVSCPHCGLSTVLRVPGVVTAEPANGGYEGLPIPMAIPVEERKKTGCVTQFIAVLLGVFLLLVFIGLWVTNWAASTASADKPSGGSRSNLQRPAIAPSDDERAVIKAIVNLSLRGVEIINASDSTWDHVVVYLNGFPMDASNYRSDLSGLGPRGTREIEFDEFVNLRGERFPSYSAQRVKSVWVHTRNFKGAMFYTRNAVPAAQPQPVAVARTPEEEAAMRERVTAFRLEQATNGLPTAQYLAGVGYAYGRDGFPTNLQLGVYWLRTSSAQGNTDAAEELRKLTASGKASTD